MLLGKGFSIVEVLIFIILLCAINAIGFPALQSLLARHRLNQAVLSWVMKIDEARGLAIERHEKIIFCPSEDGDTCAGAWNHDVLIKNKEKVLRRYLPVTKEEEIQWKNFPIQKPYLIFLSNGFLDNENGTFTYCVKKSCEKIIISKSGRVRTTFF